MGASGFIARVLRDDGMSGKFGERKNSTQACQFSVAAANTWPPQCLPGGRSPSGTVGDSPNLLR
jgi:hypothetical protein